MNGETVEVVQSNGSPYLNNGQPAHRWIVDGFSFSTSNTNPDSGGTVIDSDSDPVLIPIPGIVPKDKLIAYFLIGGSGTNRATRYIGANIISSATGWSYFITQNIIPLYKQGVRRFQLHWPFGISLLGSQTTDFDQFVMAQEEGLTWLTDQFVANWKPIVDGTDSRTGEPCEVIVYLGVPTQPVYPDNPLTHLWFTNHKAEWLSRAQASVDPLIQAGCSIGVDSASSTLLEYPDFDFLNVVESLGVKIYIESRPHNDELKAWAKFRVICENNFWIESDPDLNPDASWALPNDEIHAMSPEVVRGVIPINNGFDYTNWAAQRNIISGIIEEGDSVLVHHFKSFIDAGYGPTAMCSYYTEASGTGGTGSNPITGYDGMLVVKPIGEDLSSYSEKPLKKGLKIHGTVSNAYWDYNGPFNGYTESNFENGVLLGTVQELGYSTARHNLFLYQDNLKRVVKENSPFNGGFYSGTHYAGLNYSFINIHNRLSMPVPYSGDDGYGTPKAILVTPRHVVCLGSRPWQRSEMIRYWDSTRQEYAQTEVIATIGGLTGSGSVMNFRDELLKYMNYQWPSGDYHPWLVDLVCQMPSDVQLCIIDPPIEESVWPGIRTPRIPLGSDKARKMRCGMVIGQEMRGHLVALEGSLAPGVWNDGSTTPLFCGGLPPGASINDTLGIGVSGDEGSPLISVHGGDLLLLGLISGLTYDSGVSNNYSCTGCLPDPGTYGSYGSPAVQPLDCGNRTQFSYVDLSALISEVPNSSIWESSLAAVSGCVSSPYYDGSTAPCLSAGVSLEFCDDACVPQPPSNLLRSNKTIFYEFLDQWTYDVTGLTAQYRFRTKTLNDYETWEGAGNPCGVVEISENEETTRQIIGVKVNEYSSEKSSIQT